MRIDRKHVEREGGAQQCQTVQFFADEPVQFAVFEPPENLVVVWNFTGSLVMLDVVDGDIAVHPPEVPFLREVPAGPLRIHLAVALACKDVHEATRMWQVGRELADIFVDSHGHVQRDAAEFACNPRDGPACAGHVHAAGREPVLPVEAVYLGRMAGEVGFHGFEKYDDDVPGLLRRRYLDGVRIGVVLAVQFGINRSLEQGLEGCAGDDAWEHERNHRAVESESDSRDFLPPPQNTLEPALFARQEKRDGDE